MPNYIIRQRDRGQAEAKMFEDEAESLRPRPKFWPWGYFGLEALTLLPLSRPKNERRDSKTIANYIRKIHKLIATATEKIKQCKTQQNKTTLVQSLLMTYGQETSPRGDPWHRKQVIHQVHTTVNLCQCRNNMSREKMTHHVPNNADRSFTVTLTSKQGKKL